MEIHKCLFFIVLASAVFFAVGGYLGSITKMEIKKGKKTVTRTFKTASDINVEIFDRETDLHVLYGTLRIAQRNFDLKEFTPRIKDNTEKTENRKFCLDKAVELYLSNPGKFKRRNATPTKIANELEIYITGGLVSDKI